MDSPQTSLVSSIVFSPNDEIFLCEGRTCWLDYTHGNRSSGSRTESKNAREHMGCVESHRNQGSLGRKSAKQASTSSFESLARQTDENKRLSLMKRGYYGAHDKQDGDYTR